MKTLVALLLLVASRAGATTVPCSLDDPFPAKPAHTFQLAAARTEKTKSAAPAPTPPSAPAPKQPQRQERAPKPAPPAHLFM